MKILLASDHAGFEQKNKIGDFVHEMGYDVEDMGPYEYDEYDDYPDFVAPLAKAILERGKSGEELMGIILGGSGQGEAMVANRFRGVRAAVYYGGKMEVPELSRKHNDANVLSLGARFLSEEKMYEVVELWLKTPFSEEERHERRIEKMDNA